MPGAMPEGTGEAGMDPTFRLTPMEDWLMSEEKPEWAFGIEDVEAAARRIAPYLEPTPLRSYPLLDARLEAHVLVKHEHHQPTGAFKVRNGLTRMV